MLVPAQLAYPRICIRLPGGSSGSRRKRREFNQRSTEPQPRLPDQPPVGARVLQEDEAGRKQRLQEEEERI